VTRGSLSLATALAAVVLGCAAGDSTDESSSSGGLVFVRAVNGSADVVRARLADGAERPVTATPDRPERWPYWSDSARRLVFQVGDAEDRNASDLVLFDPQSERESALVTTPQRVERWPGWSPNGRFVVYAFRGGTPASGVALADWQQDTLSLVARSGVRDYYLRPSFSPEGLRLVAQRRSEAAGSSNLWILTAGAEPRPLTTDAAWVDIKPRFDRSGARIVYTRRRPGHRSHDVMSIDASGGEPRAVLATDANEHSARPSPLRDEVVLISDRDGSEDVFLIDEDGGEPRNLRRTPEWNELAPRWSPNGERVVVTAVPREIGRFGSLSGEVLPLARVRVLDRNGNVLLDVSGAMPDWMPPWP